MARMFLFSFLLTVLLASRASSASPFSDFTTSLSQFSFDLFKLAYNTTDNAILSPISIQSGLSMIYQVTGDVVSPDLQKFLYLPADKSLAVQNLQRFLASANSEHSDALKVLSKVYHADAELNPQVLPLFRDQCRAEVEPADFRKGNEVADRANKWVTNVTDGMIRQLVNPADLDSDVHLLLLNVITLKASWMEKFQLDRTTKAPFQFLNGEHEVDMMHTEGQFLYYYLQEYGVHAVELLYTEESDLSMIIILPLRGKSLQYLVQQLNLDLYSQFNKDPQEAKTMLELSIPKFTVQKNFKADELLQKLGLTSLFHQEDINILANRPSLIQKIIHSTFLEVDESGTKGYGSTAFMIGTRCANPSFYVDMPFLYIIRKRSTKDIIFIGHYSTYEPDTKYLS